MKNLIQNIFVALGIFAIFDWLIFPGLTASNTLLNIAALLGTVAVLLFVYKILKDEFTDRN